MDTTLWDHLLFGLSVGLSIYLFATGRAVARLLSAEGVSRAAVFLQSFVSMLTISALCALVWWTSGRDWADAGLGPAAWNMADQGFRLALYATLATIAAMALFVAAVAAGLIDRRWLERQYGYIDFLMPRRPAEYGMSLLGGTSAGIGEEALYRGFLLWYGTALGAAFFGEGAAAAAVGLALSSVLFGIAHGYQGAKGLVVTTAVGFVLGGLFWLGGSLPLLMLLHAAVDWAGFTVGYLVYRRPAEARPGTPS